MSRVPRGWTRPKAPKKYPQIVQIRRHTVSDHHGHPVDALPRTSFDRPTVQPCLESERNFRPSGIEFGEHKFHSLPKSTSASLKQILPNVS